MTILKIKRENRKQIKQSHLIKISGYENRDLTKVKVFILYEMESVKIRERKCLKENFSIDF